MRIAIVGARRLRTRRGAPAAPRARDRPVRGRLLRSAATRNTVRVDTAHETPPHRHRLHRDERPQLPQLHARCSTSSGSRRKPTHMSFSVKGEDEDFEYAGTPRGLFCQPAQPAQPAVPADDRRPAALQPRAAAAARRRARTAASRSLRLPRRRRFSRGFIERLIVPQVSAVWSADPAQMWRVPGPLPRRVLRQPRHARLPRPAALVDRRRRLGALRRGAHARPCASASGCDSPVRSIARRATASRSRRGRRRAAEVASASTRS